MTEISIKTLFDEIIINYISHFPDSDIQVLYRAYNLAHICHRGQFRKDSNPYFFHPLSVAIILADWGLDNATISAALLHDTVEDVHDAGREELRETIRGSFGEEIYNLVEGVTKKEKLPEISKDERKEVSLKKMFLYSSRDIRVIIVKIADRLHNLRTLESMKPSKQVEISMETLNVYIPLTRLLGLYGAAREMEDLCLFYLNRDIYLQLDALVDSYVPGIERQYEDFRHTLGKALKKSGLRILKLEKRKKNLFSVLKKYIRKDRPEDIDHKNIVLDEVIVSEIVRELNVVITVGSKIDLGKVLGVINSHFQNMPNTLFAYWENEVYEHFIQIGDTYGTVNIGFRCEEEKAMRLNSILEKADKSVHIRKTTKDVLDNFLSFSKILSEVKTIRPTREFFKIFEDIMSSPQMLVFTGEKQSLLIPVNSTLIDFYVLMKNLNEQDRIPVFRAYINGREVALQTRLSNNDKVDLVVNGQELIIEKEWIDDVELGITRDILNKQYDIQEAKNLAETGRDKLATKLRLMHISDDVLSAEKFWKLCQDRLGITDTDRTYKQILDDPAMLEKMVEQAREFAESGENESLSLIPRKIKKIFRRFNRQAVNIEDLDPDQISFCQRCMPLHGEYITGIWESNRLTVHRLDSESIRHISEPKECVPLKWGGYYLRAEIPAVLVVENRIGNLERLMKAFEKLEGAEILSVSHTDQVETSIINLTLGLSSIVQFNNLVRLLKRSNYVKSFTVRDMG